LIRPSNFVLRIFGQFLADHCPPAPVSYNDRPRPVCWGKKELAMADEPLTVRSISWRQVFPFINLFRAFRVAVHPSKLVLALVALIILSLGGHLLDLMWPVHNRAIADEPQYYEQFTSAPQPGRSFSDLRDYYRSLNEADYARQLLDNQIETDPASALRAARDSADLSQLKNKLIHARDDTVKAAAVVRSGRLKSAVGDDAPAARANAQREYESTVRDAYGHASSEYARACRIKNLGLFDVFFDYESNQISNAVRAVQAWNWFGEERVYNVANPLGVTGHLSGSPGVLQSVTRFFAVAPVWLLTQHPVYFFLQGIFFLVVWSIFGGAICRIAAVHVARDEKLSIRSALMFSSGKFLSFLFAPIIPLIIVVGLGLLVALGSAISGIPYLGPIIVGLLFVLALGAGFLMTLVLFGLIGGFNLMYPTVAVEGSDSFDAISRSFSYLYARPWRLGFYTLVAVVYGAVAYLFVRFFISVVLMLTHSFGGLLVFASADSTLPLWSSLWSSPGSSGRLSYDIDSLSLSFAQEIGARLIWLWVHLIVAMLGAFAVCFYFSSNTIIYYLMRREVDATDLDDVYLEHPDDEFADPIEADESNPPPGGGDSVTVSESPTS
jgi:hypothetical protein